MDNLKKERREWLHDRQDDFTKWRFYRVGLWVAVVVGVVLGVLINIIR